MATEKTKIQFRIEWNSQEHVLFIGKKWRLDVGCGANRQEGFIGIDKRKLDYSDDFVCHDIEKFPWPFKDESCSVVLFDHSVEHIKPWLIIDVIDECWRVLEFGGFLIIVTPYGTSIRAIQDPTHCNFWVEKTVFYFVPGNVLYDIYRPKQWMVEVLTYNVDNDLGFALKKIQDITPEKEKEIKEEWKYMKIPEYKRENTVTVEKVKI